MALVTQNGESQYDISPVQTGETALKNDQVALFTGYGLSETHVRSAYREHPIIQYLASLHSPESCIKVTNIIKRVAKMLEPDIVSDNGEVNIFTFPWELQQASDFALALKEMTVIRHVRNKFGVKQKQIAPASQATRNLYKSVFKQVMSFYADVNKVDVNQIYAIARIKVKKVDRPLLGQYIPKETHEAVTQYLSTLRTCRGMRDAAIFALLLHAGLRRSEIGLIQYQDIDFKDRSLMIRGKGDKQAKRPLWDEAWEPLKAYIDTWQPQLKRDHIFTAASKNDTLRDEPLRGVGVRYIINDACAGAGVESIAPHDLRRTFCTDKIEEYGETTAQHLMRHANMQTTQRYNMKVEAQTIKLRDKNSRHSSSVDQ